MKKLVWLICDLLCIFFYAFYIVELSRFMYLRLLYLMYVVEIKFHVLKLILCRVKDKSTYIIRTCQVQDFSMIHITPTIFVVHDTKKLV